MPFDYHQLLSDILEDKLTARQAAELLHTAEPGIGGLALAPGSMTPEQLTKLDQCFAAIRWELAKLTVPGRLPDVEFGSPAYESWKAKVPTSHPEPPNSA